MRSSKGFTLIELLTTVTVLAIILGIAAPGFTDLIRSNRAQTQSAGIAAAINLARSEAIKRGVSVSVISSDGSSSWVRGWKVWVDSDGDNLIDSGEPVIRDVPALSGAGVSLPGKSYTTSGSTISRNSSANVSVARFDNQGRLLNTSTGVLMTGGSGLVFEFGMGSSYCSLGRDIFVNHLGRVSIQRKVCQ